MVKRRILFWGVVFFALFAQRGLFAGADEENTLERKNEPRVIERERDEIEDSEKEAAVREELNAAEEAKPVIPDIKNILMQPVFPGLKLPQIKPASPVLPEKIEKFSPPALPQRPAIKKLELPSPKLPEQPEPLKPVVPRPQILLPRRVEEIPKPRLPALPEAVLEIELPPVELKDTQEKSLNEN